MLKSNYSSHLYGFTDLKSLKERGPTIITHGKGIYVYDIHKKKYLDANSGLWNSCAGFDHKGIIEVAQKQYCKIWRLPLFIWKTIRRNNCFSRKRL